MRFGRAFARRAARYTARRVVYQALPRRSVWRGGIRWQGLRFGVGWGIGRLFHAFWK